MTMPWYLTNWGGALVVFGSTLILGAAGTAFIMWWDLGRKR